jgi:hypothetical protein
VALPRQTGEAAEGDPMPDVRTTLRTVAIAAVLSLLWSPARAQGAKPLKKCPPDAVVAGTVCMDKYEASVWRVPDPTGANRFLVSRIQQGRATLAQLLAGGATQVLANFHYPPCSNHGQNCADDVYAVSLPGVMPSAWATWFQASAACENSRKRLPTNAEWQAAAAGTPDPGPDDGTTDCNSASPSFSATGARANCVSARGAFDMVGNLDEWVADWVPKSSACGSWLASMSPTGDYQCLAGAATTGEPAALRRGGSAAGGPNAGPLAVIGSGALSVSLPSIGFRCAR